MNNINTINVDIINTHDNINTDTNINTNTKSIKKKKKNKETDLVGKNNILEYYFNLPIKSKKIFIKLLDEDIVIPNYKEYNNLLTINYSASQLKLIAKHHKLKTTGNKEYLKKRLYNYLYFSYNIINIQKVTRNYLTKKYIKLHGPGFYNKELCSNDVDFCTLDNLCNIPYNQFISFKDDNEHIYGFDILSLYNLFIKVTKNNKSRTYNELNNNSNSALLNVQNPFTNVFFSYNILKQLLEYIRLSYLLNIHIDLNYEDLAHLSINKQIEMKILTLFQRIDSLGNYTNIKWFLDLDKYGLIRFIRELVDIWNYRANLSQETKREIVPPYGNPFYDEHLNVTNLPQYNFAQIRKYSIVIIDLMINRGINENSCLLGSYYVLCALTMVSSDAANTLPWLYEAVNH
jgi:hypothetical protein